MDQLTVEGGVLWAHIAAGVVAVLAGTAAMLTEKGGRRHRLAGRTFVRSMAVVVGTVPVLLVFDPTSFLRQFLVLVGVFSGYLAFSGYRAIARGRSTDWPGTADRVAAALAGAACLGMGAWGVVLLAGGDGFGTVLVAFGGLGVAFVGVDARTFHRHETGGAAPARLATHLSRMVGAFIATVSAVSVVNLSSTLGVVSWLWPTVAFLPLILYWLATYADEGPLAGVFDQ